MTFTTIRALHASIGSAIDDLERIYHTQPEPLDFPALDIPYYTAVAAPAPTDQKRAEELIDDPAVALALQRVVSACEHLSATVNKPLYGLQDVTQGAAHTACMRVLEAAHVVEILREAGPEGLHVRDIHALVVDLRPKDCLPDPAIFTVENLAHVLRCLATTHWLREVSPDVFANNRRSSFIDSGKTIDQLRSDPDSKYTGTNGVAASVGLNTDEATKWMSYLLEWLLPDTRAGSLVVDAQIGAGPNGGSVKKFPTPFHIAFNTELDLYPWLELPENKSRVKRFGHAMTSSRQFEMKDDLLHGFPWAELPPDATLVDSAGGIGSASLSVIQAHPHIKVVVEDRASTVARAPTAWGDKFTSLFASGRMSWRARDLRTPWVPLPSGDVPDAFLIRFVLHDWPDVDCRTMLRGLRAGAGPNTKLVIGDMLLFYACQNEDALVEKDSPLLANLGMANLHGYLMDIMAIGAFAAKERTIDEMAELALSAGWKISDVRRSTGSVWAYITAVPV